MMRYHIVFLLIISSCTLHAQIKVDLKNFSRQHGTTAIVKGDVLSISWPAGKSKTGKLIFDLSDQQPIFKSIELQEGSRIHQIASGLDPVFILTVGKRDLVSPDGWNIFF